MYIWILLATIMMMFSFYNLAPRTDKEDSLVEIKAATVVNRFRAESAAFMKAFECQAILGETTGDTDWKDNKYVVKSSDNPDYGYTSLRENLPIGYEFRNDMQVYHTVLCLDRPIDRDEINLLQTCGPSTDGQPIYMISFVPIPEQWLSKTDLKKEVKPPHPAPELIHYISDANNGGITYGWVECAQPEDGNFECQLSGYHARFADVEDTGNMDEEGNSIQERTYKQIHSSFWQKMPELFKNEEFGCMDRPCLFAFHRVPLVDFKEACNKALCEDREGYDPPDKCNKSGE